MQDNRELAYADAIAIANISRLDRKTHFFVPILPNRASLLFSFAILLQILKIVKFYSYMNEEARLAFEAWRINTRSHPSVISH